MKIRRNLPLAGCVWLLLALAAAAPARAADETGPPSAELRLRRWHLGLQSAGSWRNTLDAFDRPGLPPGDVDRRGRGVSLALGRRCGDRFLAQLQVAQARHDQDDDDGMFNDVALLLTGTVLFGPTRTLQPFLRGGIGGTVLAFQPDGSDGVVYAFGPAAIAGGGAQVRLGGRVSLEFEAVATFTDFLEVHDETDDAAWGGDTWQVRTSNHGWRAGAGVVFWF